MGLRLLRIVGILEGASLIILMGVCMPLKYIYKIPEPTEFVGMAHGVLFVLFEVMILYLMSSLPLSKWKILILMLSAIVPFGTWYADVKFLKPLQQKDLSN